MSITPQDLQKLLDERETSRASRKRAWENLQEIRWVLKDIIGIELPPPARKTIDLEGRLVKDGVRTALRGPATRSPDGLFNIDLGTDPINRIDIEDIDKVTFFKNTTENEITTIEINFAGDGSFFIQYVRNGKLLKFHGAPSRV
jgi:hypothetical protein